MTVAKKFSEQVYSLQVLRGIAAILVVLYHLEKFSKVVFYESFFNSIFSFGYSGVDIFFVLSGFIIFFVNKNAFGNKGKVITYLVKRFTRIYPIYWIVCFFVIPAFFIFPKYGQGYETQISSVVASWFLIPQAHDPIISVAWTLIHEVKFYVLFSTVFVFGLKGSLKILIPVLTISLVDLLSRLNGAVIFHNPLLANLFSFYNIEFFLGCLAAYLIDKVKLENCKLLLFTSVAIFLFNAFIYENFLFSLKDAGRIIFYGLPSFGIVFSLAKMELQSSVNFGKLMIILGDSSYSIYLIHQITIAVVLRSTQLLGIIYNIPSFIYLLLLGLFTIFLGIFIHNFIEKPAIQYTRTLTGIHK